MCHLYYLYLCAHLYYLYYLYYLYHVLHVRVLGPYSNCASELGFTSVRFGLLHVLQLCV